MARVLKEIKCFGGVVRQLSHASAATKTQMGFTVFLPPAAQTQAVPVRAPHREAVASLVSLLGTPGTWRS